MLTGKSERLAVQKLSQDIVCLSCYVLLGGTSSLSMSFKKGKEMHTDISEASENKYSIANRKEHTIGVLDIWKSIFAEPCFFMTIKLYLTSV